MADAAKEIPAGTIVGDRWRVESKLGGGGMSVIYEVRHTRTTKRAALKVMLLEYAESKLMQLRFTQEMTVTASLQGCWHRFSRCSPAALRPAARAQGDWALASHCRAGLPRCTAEA